MRLRKAIFANASSLRPIIGASRDNYLTMETKQETSAWNSKNFSMEYFTRQLKNPYQSTVAFFDFLEEENLMPPGTSIVDACCGSGGNIFYAENRFSLNHIIGFDYQEEFLSIAENCKSKAKSEGAKAVSFWHADIYNLRQFNERLRERRVKIDGIVFLQTMSWLTNWRESLIQLSSLNTKWIAISSLFYEGFIEAEITTKTYQGSTEKYVSLPYNIYSIPLVEDCLRSNGFKDFIWKPFNLVTPIARPDDINKMGTYSVETKDGTLLQKSGPLLLPWHFLIAKR